MKPTSFRYERARSLSHAVELLATLDEDARVLAGGQSLVPLMNLRLARPTALIDINTARGADHISVDERSLRIGALVRHSAIERYRGALGVFEVLRRAARLVGHYGIRERGTFGGSVAHADPAAEWCLMSCLLGAEVKVEGTAGVRFIPAVEFFTGAFTTVLDGAEVVSEVRFPRTGLSHAGIDEFAPRQGDFAVVAAGAALRLYGQEAQDVRIAVAGAGPVPRRVPEAEEVLDDRYPSPTALEEAAEAAAASTVHADGVDAHRRRLVRGLVHRALEEALADGG